MSSKNTSAFIMLLQQVNEINKNIVTPEVFNTLFNNFPKGENLVKITLHRT